MKKTFTVESIPLAERNFLDILSSAKNDVTQDAVIRAMKEARQLLETEAHNAGEPLFDLRQMKMNVRRILVVPLYIEYGVQLLQPVVVIRRVVLLR